MSSTKVIAVLIIALFAFASIAQALEQAQAPLASEAAPTPAAVTSPKCLALGGKCQSSGTCVPPNLSVQRLCDDSGYNLVCCVKRTM